jgi:hypothetical protein
VVTAAIATTYAMLKALDLEPVVPGAGALLFVGRLLKSGETDMSDAQSARDNYQGVGASASALAASRPC